MSAVIGFSPPAIPMNCGPNEHSREAVYLNDSPPGVNKKRGGRILPGCGARRAGDEKKQPDDF
ncbi:hypothetical protein ACUUL3_08050 [Thiovibrio sp. JS02]